MNNKGTNPLEDAKLIFDFYVLYKKLEIDVILHYTIKPNIYGSIAAGILGIPVISNISGLGTVFLDEKFSSKIARFLYKLALRTPKKVFYQNRNDRDLFIDAKLVDERKTDVLAGSGIDSEKFKPMQVKKKSDKVNFIFIARLLKDKGIVEYVEAARILVKNKRIACYILGAYYDDNPSAISENEMKVWEEEGIIIYLGSSDDVARHIASIDCVVLPSYREGLSRVLLEAASMEKPIITTNVPGCKEVVEDGINGYLCEVKDSVSLANKMKKIASLSCEERLEMGRKGREKVIIEFDEKLVIEKYKKALSEIFKHKS